MAPNPNGQGVGIDPRSPRQDGFDIGGGMPRGPSHVVRAARDAVRPPEDPEILALLKRTLCRAQLGVNCFEIVSVDDAITEIGYGATFEQWKKTCERILAESIWKTR